MAISPVLPVGADGQDFVSVDGRRHWRDRLALDLRDFGAVANGVADDTVAFQAALTYLAATSPRGGGQILVVGTVRVTGTLYVLSENVNIVGAGRRNLQTFPLPALGTLAASTIVNGHAGPLFKLAHIQKVNGFRVRDITLLGNGATTTAGNVALDWDLAGNGIFMRDFSLERVGITGFQTALMTRATSTEDPAGSSDGQIGLLRVRNCNIMHNGFIAQCLNATNWNGFWFHENDAGQNGANVGYGGLHIKGHNVSIQDNVLEGQRDPIKLLGFAGRGTVLKGNYFEADTGDACINVDSLIGPVEIGPNFYGAAASTHKVLIGNSVGGGTCVDRWWPVKCHKIHPLPNAIVNTDSTEFRLSAAQLTAATPWVYTDAPHEDYLSVPKGASNIFSANLSTPLPGLPAFRPPGIGRNMPVEISTLGATGIVTIANASYAATAGQILVVNWLFRRTSAAGDGVLYALISPDGSTTNGFDGTIDGLTRYFRDDEWVSLTIAIPVIASFTSLNVSLYPYGVSAASVTGKTVERRRPTLYLCSDVNDIRPYHANPYIGSNATPATGTWEVGDEVFNSAPAAGGTHKWICTTAGTPGTWKAVSIAA